MNGIKLSYREILRTCEYWEKEYNWKDISEITMISPQYDGIHVHISKDIDLPNNVPFISIKMIPINNIRIQIIKELFHTV